MIVSFNMRSLSGCYAVFCCTIFALICLQPSCVNSHTVPVKSTVKAVSSTPITPPPISPINCNDSNKIAKLCFKDLSPHLVEFLQSEKAAATEEDIIAKCTVFDLGMSCFDEYTARCFNSEMLEIYQSNVAGARNFFNKFCNDTAFRKDYLQHKNCFSYIETDWARCTESFQTLLANELFDEEAMTPKKFLSFCCARKAYENCIYTSARYKCYQESAEYARDTAKTLSDEKHFNNCRPYEEQFCTRRDSSAASQGCGGWGDEHNNENAWLLRFFVLGLLLHFLMRT